MALFASPYTHLGDWVCYPWQDVPLFASIHGGAGGCESIKAAKPFRNRPVLLKSRSPPLTAALEFVILHRRPFKWGAVVFNVYMADGDERPRRALAYFCAASALFNFIRLVCPYSSSGRAAHS